MWLVGHNVVDLTLCGWLDTMWLIGHNVVGWTQCGWLNTMWLVGYNETMKVHFRVLEVSVIYSYPTNHVVQINMDFHCFDSSTTTC